MATQVITDPMLLDSTGQGIVSGLTDIAHAVQPINIYLDVQMSIPVEGWSDTNPHTYTWLYNRITAECGIEVHFMEGAEDVDMKYLEYDKIAGGIQFEIDEIPDKAIPLMIRIINAQTSAVIDPIDDTLVTSNAVSGAVNVHEALVNHEGRLSDAEGAVGNCNTIICLECVFGRCNVICAACDAKAVFSGDAVALCRASCKSCRAVEHKVIQ